MRIKLIVCCATAVVGLLLTETSRAVHLKPAGTFQLSAAGEGRRLFLSQNCYGCHGGRGGGGMGPSLRREAEDVTEALREGEEGGMPAYPALTATDAKNLSAYFKSLRTPAEPTFTRWWEPVPTQ